MKKGLILGRFQPFHLGHLELIKSIIDQQIEPVICIGSAQHSYTEENPFTVEERMKMIEEVMKDFNCKYSIFGICLLYTSPSPRDGLLSRMPSSA